MHKLSRFFVALLAVNFACERTFAQNDDPKPTPATITTTRQPQDPNLLPQHDQLRRDAEQAYQRNDHKKVIELSNSVLAENSMDHIAYYWRASSRVELGIANQDPNLVRQGISDARESIKIKPQDNYGYFMPYLYGMTNLAGLENKKGHADVAVLIAGQLIAQAGLKGENRSNALYQRALAHLARQDSAKAIADYQEAIRVTPNHLGALIGLAETLAATGRNADAMNAFNAAARAFPNLPLVYNNRGMFQQSIGKLEDAILDFSKAMELDPQFVAAITNRGFVLMNQGQHEQAETDFTHSLSINAAQPAVIRLRAESKLTRGDLPAAVADYTEVLKWDSKNAYGHMELGFALFFSGKTPEALAELDKASELDPKLRFLLPWRYLAMLALDQKKQADEKFAADLAIPKEKRDWVEQLLAYLSDKVTEQDLRKGVHPTDPKIADAQTCEAEFFIGQRKWVAGQKEAARVHFTAALKSKATNLSAYRGAKFAVK